MFPTVCVPTLHLLPVVKSFYYSEEYYLLNQLVGADALVVALPRPHFNTCHSERSEANRGIKILLRHPVATFPVTLAWGFLTFAGSPHLNVPIN